MRQFRLTKALLLFVAGWLMVGCSNHDLAQVEQLMETDVKAADSILSTVPMPTSRRDRAWYAVLKTQVDYKQRKTITSDRLIISATDYYGTSIKGTQNRRYKSAMAWYSQGCVYSVLNNDFAAIDAYLKAKDLFPDTLIRYYALTEQNLGNIYLNRMMIDEAEFQFRCCQINAERLQDVRMSNYSFFYRGLCALYRKSFLLADSIFKEISNNSNYTFYQRSVATMQLAKIYLYFYNDNVNALNLINNYLNMIKDREYGPGLGIKAEILYAMEEYDSAYYYYNESVINCDELYSKCSDADRLSELSSLKGNTEESIYWHKLYGELRDSINKIERDLEIEEIQFIHNEELVQEKYAHRHRIIIIIYSSVLLIVVVILLFIYSMFKYREKERILKKRQELQIEEEKIRKSTIELLESKIKAYSIHDPEARTVLLKSYSNRLKMCTNAFVATPEYKMLCSYKLNVKELNKDEKEALFYQIKRSYMEAFTDFQNEVPGISENDILTIILKYQSLSVEHISSLFSITTDSVKKRLYRLSQRVSSDFLDIYSI